MIKPYTSYETNNTKNVDWENMDKTSLLNVGYLFIQQLFDHWVLQYTHTQTKHTPLEGFQNLMVKGTYFPNQLW